MNPKRAKQLFDLLQSHKLVDAPTIARITKAIALSGASAHASLFESTKIKEGVLNRALAKVYNLKTVEIEQFARWDPEAFKIREAMARKYRIVPLVRKGKTWIFACDDPDDQRLTAELPALLKAPVELRVVTDVRLAWMLNKAFNVEGNIRLFVLFERLEKPAPKPAEVAPVAAPAPAKKQVILTVDGLVEADAHEAEPELLDQSAFDEFYGAGSATPQKPKAPEPKPAPTAAKPEAPKPAVAKPVAPAPQPVAPLSIAPQQAAVEAVEEAVEDAAMVEEAMPVIEEEPEVIVQRKALTREEAVAALAKADTREALADILLGFAQTKFKRAVLMSIDNGHVVGWAGVGEGITPAAVSAIWFPTTADSVFKTVCTTNSQFVGPIVATNPVHERMFKLLGGAKPKGIFLMPILYQGEVNQLVWLDDGDGQPAGYDIGDVLILAYRVPAALDALVKRTQAEMAA